MTEVHVFVTAMSQRKIMCDWVAQLIPATDWTYYWTDIPKTHLVFSFCSEKDAVLFALRWK